MVDPDPLVVGVVLAMAAVTYATKAGGLWLLGNVDVGERTEAGLETLLGPTFSPSSRRNWPAAAPGVDRSGFRCGGRLED